MVSSSRLRFSALAINTPFSIRRRLRALSAGEVSSRIWLDPGDSYGDGRLRCFLSVIRAGLTQAADLQELRRTHSKFVRYREDWLDRRGVAIGSEALDLKPGWLEN